MTDKEIEEVSRDPEYIIPPHPEARVVLDEEVVVSEEPIMMEGSVSDLIQQAADAFRIAMRTELEVQTQMMQAVLQSEIEKVSKGDEFIANNQKLPVG